MDIFQISKNSAGAEFNRIDLKFSFSFFSDVLSRKKSAFESVTPRTHSLKGNGSAHVLYYIGVI